MQPTTDMIEAAAQRLVRWEDGCVWPDSWDALTVAAARQDAERALRSGLQVMNNSALCAISKATADYYAGRRDIHEIMKELKDVERDNT